MKKIFTLLSVFILTTLFSSCIILADGEWYGNGISKDGKVLVYEGTLTESQINNSIYNAERSIDPDTGAYYFSEDLESSEFYDLKAKLSANESLKSSYYTRSELKTKIRALSDDESEFTNDVVSYMFSSSYSHYLYAVEIFKNGQTTHSFYVFMK